MNIGIVGLGVIGTANQVGFLTNGYKVVSHDIKLGTKLIDIIIADIIYICLPTPSAEDGSCDTSIIEGCIKELNKLNYKGPIVVRSTVIPGFTNKMNGLYPNLLIGFSPEFLRERSAVDDFIKNHNLLVIGSSNPELIKLVKLSHGNLPKNTVIMSPTEAELLKYYNNVYASLRITFANNFYELCMKLGSDYSKIKNAYMLTGKTSGQYLDVNDNLRGYAGPCLPKDTDALAKLFRDKGLDVKLIQSIIDDNSKYRPTVFDGMRL